MSGSTLESLMKRLLKTIEVRTYHKDQVIVYPGNAINMVYYVAKGAVVMHDIHDDGTQTALNLFGRQSLFPLRAYSCEEDLKYEWFFTAIVDSEIYPIPYDTFREYIRKLDGPAVHTLLSMTLIDRRDLLRRISSLSYHASVPRVAGILQYLADYHSKQVDGTSWRRVHFPVHHQLVADMCGLTRETVTLTLGQLRDDGAINYDRSSRISIHPRKLDKAVAAHATSTDTAK